MKSYALITGATAGIGKALAKVFAQNNKNLFLIARGQDRLTQFSQELKNNYAIDVITLAADLSEGKSAQNIFDFTQKNNMTIDCLVNNAGFGTLGEFSQIELNEQSRMIQLNIMSLVELMGYLLPAMKERKNGKILNIGSIAGFNPGAYMNTYYATKAFVNSFSQALHHELENTGVTVTLSCPGPTSTEFGKRAKAANKSMFKKVNMTAERVATESFEAMNKGQRIIIHGTKNKLLMLLTQFLPQFLVIKIIGQLNRAAARA